jgi:multicomponent Na+:H+ antiporter subunit G
MTSFLVAAAEVLSLGLLGLGLLFWFAGTWPLLGRASFLTKLHYLGVSDTLGSALMLLGLLLRLNREWPLLLLALLALLIWDTIFGYVLAACSQSPPRR